MQRVGPDKDIHHVGRTLRIEQLISQLRICAEARDPGQSPYMSLKSPLRNEQQNDQLCRLVVARLERYSFR